MASAARPTPPVAANRTPRAQRRRRRRRTGTGTGARAGGSSRRGDGRVSRPEPALGPGPWPEPGRPVRAASAEPGTAARRAVSSSSGIVACAAPGAAPMTRMTGPLRPSPKIAERCSLARSARVGGSPCRAPVPRDGVQARDPQERAPGGRRRPPGVRSWPDRARRSRRRQRRGSRPARTPAIRRCPSARAGFGLPNLRRNVCPHFYMTGIARRDPDPGAAPAQGAHPPGRERLALPAARRRPPGAGLRQRRLPDAALQPVRLLRGRPDARVTTEAETTTAALQALAERGRFGIRLGLGRTRALLRELGDPQRSIRGALVAGTNGKGSVLALARPRSEQAGLPRRRDAEAAPRHLSRAAADRRACRSTRRRSPG